MYRWEAFERDKLDVLRQAFGTQKLMEGAPITVQVERLAVQVKALEAQAEELREVAQEQAAQGKEMQREVLDQG